MKQDVDNLKLFRNGFSAFGQLLMGGRLIPEQGRYSDWGQVLTGSGHVTNGNLYVEVGTGVTASSTAVKSQPMAGLNPANAHWVYIDWRKPLYMGFWVARTTSEAETHAYVQLKDSNAYGQLAQFGIGIEIVNLTLSGESYGTVRGTTGSVLMTSTYPYWVWIEHDPVNGLINWYVNGVLIGTETTSTHIPNSSAGAQDLANAAIGNGVSGGTDALLEAGSFIWFQKH